MDYSIPTARATRKMLRQAGEPMSALQVCTAFARARIAPSEIRPYQQDPRFFELARKTSDQRKLVGVLVPALLTIAGIAICGAVFAHLSGSHHAKPHCEVLSPRATRQEHPNTAVSTTPPITAIVIGGVARETMPNGEVRTYIKQVRTWSLG